MKGITVRAPGKLMLFGEHAVVYGYPCIVAAVGEYLEVTARRSSGNGIRVVVPEGQDTRFLNAVARSAAKEWGKAADGISVEVTRAFSSNFGLGSSSAVTVAAFKAIAVAAGMPLLAKDLFRLAYRTVLEVQGVGSGFDVASASFGGAIRYVKGNADVQALPVDIPGCSWVVGYSGVKADTATVVREVALRMKTEKGAVADIFRIIDGIVKDAGFALAKGDGERVGTLLDRNQEALSLLGVSSEPLDRLIRASRNAGALGAKLSGAGKGDCMIALCPEDAATRVRDAIVKEGGRIVGSPLGVPGASVNTTDNQEELFVVVDADDREIGFRTRGECHRDASIIHRTVGAMVYSRDGKLLLQKRSMTKDMDAGLWGLSCAGHVTKGQTPEEAMERELEEELGIRAKPRFITKFLASLGEETEYAYLYRVDHDGPFQVDPLETDRVEFFPVDRVRKAAADGSIRLSPATILTLRKAGIV